MAKYTKVMIEKNKNKKTYTLFKINLSQYESLIIAQ